MSKARDHLLGLQHSDGYWKGELETNVSIEAEDLLLREFLGIRGDRETQATANWIRAKQRDDGTWANFYGGPPEHSTTTEAYTALKLAGDSPDADHMRKAASLHSGVRRHRAHSGIHTDLAGVVRPLVVGKIARAAAGADLPALSGRLSISTTSRVGPDRPSWP